MFAFYSLEAVLLPLFVVCLLIGTRPDGGYRRRFASMRMKGRGTQTPATATTAGSSFYLARGDQSGVSHVLTSLRQENSFTGHGLSMRGTDTVGASGAPPERAGCDE